MIGRRGFFKLLAGAAVGAMITLPAPAAPVNLSVPMTWTPVAASQADKIAMIKAMLDRAIQAHDDLLEQAIFNEASNDIRGLPSWFEGTDSTAA